MMKSAHHPTYVALINWLKTVREEQGLSVRELADRLGEDHTIIVKIEKRVRKLSVFEYYQYCQALNVDPIEGLQLMKAAEERVRF